jgi:hypothetical protein
MLRLQNYVPAKGIPGKVPLKKKEYGKEFLFFAVTWK